MSRVLLPGSGGSSPRLGTAISGTGEVPVWGPAMGRPRVLRGATALPAVERDDSCGEANGGEGMVSGPVAARGDGAKRCGRASSDTRVMPRRVAAHGGVPLRLPAPAGWANGGHPPLARRVERPLRLIVAVGHRGRCSWPAAVRLRGVTARVGCIPFGQPSAAAAPLPKSQKTMSMPPGEWPKWVSSIAASLRCCMPW